MKDKLEKLLLEVSTLVEKYSDDENYVSELNINGFNESTDEMFSIKLVRNRNNVIINVLKSKQCGNYSLIVRREENEKRKIG